MKGNLKRSFDKGGRFITRELNADRKYLLKNGKMILLPGRSLMLVRNVGHLMTNPSVKDSKGNPKLVMVLINKKADDELDDVPLRALIRARPVRN